MLQPSPQRPSPRVGGGGKPPGGELDALYARAMALSKEKEQAAARPSAAARGPHR